MSKFKKITVEVEVSESLTTKYLYEVSVPHEEVKDFKKYMSEEEDESDKDIYLSRYEREKINEDIKIWESDIVSVEIKEEILSQERIDLYREIKERR